MTDQGIHRVETYSWMKPITPKNDPKRIYYTIGKMLDYKRDTLAVSMSGTGATRLYCVEHGYIFPVRDDGCELCRAAAPSQGADVQQEASVTPL